MSQDQLFLSEILEDKPIPIGKLSYFRERFRDHLYELVVEEFLKREAEGLKRADLARRIGRRPEQITRWLNSPGNWTLETVSDLVLAVCKAEPKVRLQPLSDRIVRNHIGQSVLESQHDVNNYQEPEVSLAKGSRGPSAGARSVYADPIQKYLTSRAKRVEPA